jgi:uncharacterized membrane protein
MMMGFGFGGMFLFWGALLALLIGGAAWVLRLSTGTDVSAQSTRAAARQVLDERLARGEITREEYDLVLVRIEQ